MASTSELRKALEKAHSKATSLTTKRGERAKTEGLKRTGRGLALSGVKGPIAEKVKTKTALSFEDQLADQLTSLGIQQAKGEQDIAAQEIAMKREEDVANLQLISDIFGGIGETGVALFGKEGLFTK